VEQISEVRLSLARGESMRSVSARCQMSRNTVRKIARTGLTEFTYKRREPAYPVLGLYMERLEQILRAEQDKPKKSPHVTTNL